MVEVTSVRIIQKTTNYDRKERLSTPRPFSEVLITADGKHYCTRLFHVISNDAHARAAQTQDFLRRMGAASRAG